MIVKDLKISAPSDINYWGGSFCENGLFILLEIQGDAEKPAQERGKEILDSILTKITNFPKINLEVLNELTIWVKEIKSVISLILGFLDAEILYLVNLGNGKVMLSRNGQSGTILPSGESSSGKVQSGDRLFFTSNKFITCIGKEKQKELLRSESLTEIAENAYGMLVACKESAGSIAILADLEKQEITEEKKLEMPDSSKINYKTILKQKWQKTLLFIKEKKAGFWQEDEESKPKRTLLTIAVILILLLIASIFLNINHSQSANRQNRLKQVVDLVSHQYDEAVSLIDLNPSRARILLSDSKLSLSQVFKEFPKNSDEYKQINDWLNKIAEKEVEAYKIQKFTTVPLFFDLNLIKNGGIGSNMALHKKSSVILDLINKAIYSLSLDTKQASIIAGSEIVKEARTIATHGKSAYILTEDGITQVDIPSKSAKVAIANDKKWGEITQLYSFAGNVYLLDSKNNAIWKYIASENGFSARTSYLNSDVSVSLDKPRKLVIDGSVWVITNSGSIMKFTNGRPEAFSFKGIADNLSDIASIFTSDEEKFLYVLDKNSQRILVFDKEGNYQAQYQWDELKNADDMVVSEDEKKIFVLSGSRIYAIDIK